MKALLKLFVLVWMVERCSTYNDAVLFLNTLPPERAVEAKIVATDWAMPVIVFYRKDK